MKKIRVGFLLDSIYQPKWINNVIKDVNSNENCDVCFVGLNCLEIKGNPQRSKNKKLFSVVSYIERKLLSGQLDQFKVERIPIKKGTPIFSLHGELKNNVSLINSNSIELVKQQDLNLIIRFGFGILKGEILRCADFGVWSFHHGDNNFYRGRPACFWEIMNKESKVGAILQVLNTELDNGVVINNCCTRVVKSSLWLTMNQLFGQSSELVINSINRIVENHGEMYWSQKSQNTFYTNELFRYPNSYFTLLYFTRLVLAFCVGRFRKVSNNWTVKIKRHNSTKKGYFGFSFYGFKSVDYKSKGFIADPFIRDCDKNIDLFVEEYDSAKKRGKILKIVLDSKFEIVGTQVVLEEKFHVSYPFIFETGGNWYMLPESAESRAVSLYKENSDGQFVFIRNLLINGHFFDPTLTYYEGKYWLFVTRKSKGGLHDCELCCFFSNDLFAEDFRPHPLNPIKMDVTSSRPAGSIFVQDGILYRPSQNGSVSYGGSISINKIVKLSETDFCEELVTVVLPRWNSKLKGVHTLNFSQNHIVIDVNYG